MRLNRLLGQLARPARMIPVIRIRIFNESGYEVVNATSEDLYFIAKYGRDDPALGLAAPDWFEIYPGESLYPLYGVSGQRARVEIRPELLAP